MGHTLIGVPDHRNSVAALVDDETGEVVALARYVPEGAMSVLAPDGTIECDERTSLTTVFTLPIPFGGAPMPPGSPT